jgi:hypothetical protein
MERNWDAVQDWLGELLAERGVDRISAEELTVPPGMDELFSLLQIKRHHEEGRFDCVIVDCAPTGETLRLLSFPPERTRLVLNRANDWVGLKRGEVGAVLGRRVDFELPSDPMVPVGVNRGEPAVLLDRSTPFGRGVLELLSELVPGTPPAARRAPRFALGRS